MKLSKKKFNKNYLFKKYKKYCIFCQFFFVKNILRAGLGWYTPLITALEKHRQVYLCESEDSLVYRVPGYTERPCHEKVSKQRSKKCPKNEKNTILFYCRSFQGQMAYIYNPNNSDAGESQVRRDTLESKTK